MTPADAAPTPASEAVTTPEAASARPVRRPAAPAPRAPLAPLARGPVIAAMLALGALLAATSNAYGYHRD
jgi:hypothetical protein